MSTTKMPTIEARLRTTIGKGHARKTRKNGWIPGIILEKGKSTMIELDPKWLSRAHLGDKRMNLVLNGKTSVMRIHELQIDAVKRLPLHVDLVKGE